MFRRKNRDLRHGEDVATSISNNNNDFDKQAQYLVPAEVRMISGCHSLETSADVSNIHSIVGRGKLPSPEGRAGGACTTALLSILYEAQQARGANSSSSSNDNNNNNSNNYASGDYIGTGTGTGTDTSITFQKLLLELRRRLAQTGVSQIPQLTSSRPLELEETPFSLRGTPREGRGGTATATATQRALLVGINYYGQNGQLSGCINDVANVKKYLCNHCGFEEKHVLLLIDDGRNHHPTRDNIIRALRRLVEHSKPGDSVYFHYSGHGGLLDPNYWNRFKAGVSKKEYDETLYPVDHARAGQIRDFNLFHHFVKPMAAGVTVTCVMDCCHSGSVLDLPYSYRPTSDGTIRMRQSMDSLTNLAFLYILAGGMLPDLGFESIAETLENATGETMENLQGIGVEELSSDVDGCTSEYANGSDFVTDNNTDLDGTVNDDRDFIPEDGGVDYGGDEITGEDLNYGVDSGGFDGFGASNLEDVQTDFIPDDYGADGDCGGNDCDGCDAMGEILSMLFEE